MDMLPYIVLAAVSFVFVLVIFLRDVRNEIRDQRDFFTDWNQRIEDTIKELQRKD